MPIVFTVVAIVLILDQVTKHLVVYNMALGESIELIPNLLYITSHRNSGAAWGIMQGQMAFFYVITLVVIAVLIAWIRRVAKTRERLLLIALSLLLAGAIGNFIDRILFRQVVDFVDSFIFGYNFPIFNVADMSLTFGVILMGIDALLETGRKKKY